jgi:hypothetical protein
MMALFQQHSPSTPPPPHFFNTNKMGEIEDSLSFALVNVGLDAQIAWLIVQ